jgi:hypothetical protein
LNKKSNGAAWFLQGNESAMAGAAISKDRTDIISTMIDFFMRFIGHLLLFPKTRLSFHGLKMLMNRQGIKESGLGTIADATRKQLIRGCLSKASVEKIFRKENTGPARHQGLHMTAQTTEKILTRDK